MAYKLAGAARESLRKKVTRIIRESWARRGNWFLPRHVDDAARDAIMFKEEQIEIRRKAAKEEAEQRRLQEAEQEHERQLKEEKIQRIARQEEIRMNEMRAKERMLAEERRLRKR